MGGWTSQWAKTHWAAKLENYSSFRKPGRVQPTESCQSCPTCCSPSFLFAKTWKPRWHISLWLTELFRSRLLGQGVAHVAGEGPSMHVAGGTIQRLIHPQFTDTQPERLWGWGTLRARPAGGSLSGPSEGRPGPGGTAHILLALHHRHCPLRGGRQNVSLSYPDIPLRISHLRAGLPSSTPSMVGRA